jgi:hypothetical protein
MQHRVTRDQIEYGVQKFELIKNPFFQFHLADANHQKEQIVEQHKLEGIFSTNFMHKKPGTIDPKMQMP